MTSTCIASRLRASLAVALAAALVGLVSPLPATTRAAGDVPTRLLFRDLPTEVFAGRTFDIVVAIVAFPDSLGVVVTDGTSATVTLSLESSPVPGAAFACTSDLTLPTETSGADAGTVTFSGCTIDKVGEPYMLKAAASNVTATTPPTPVLADATSEHYGPVRVRPAIEAPQDTIEVSITHNGTAEWVTWRDTVTVRIEFAVNGSN